MLVTEGVGVAAVSESATGFPAFTGLPEPSKTGLPEPSVKIPSTLLLLTASIFVGTSPNVIMFSP